MGYGFCSRSVGEVDNHPAAWQGSRACRRHGAAPRVPGGRATSPLKVQPIPFTVSGSGALAGWGHDRVREAEGSQSADHDGPRLGLPAREPA